MNGDAVVLMALLVVTGTAVAVTWRARPLSWWSAASMVALLTVVPVAALGVLDIDAREAALPLLVALAVSELVVALVRRHARVDALDART